MKYTLIKSCGFTLLELIIVTALLLIVTTIGVASYGEYSKRIADEYGKILIKEIIGAQKVAFIHNRKYFNSFKAIGYPTEIVDSQFNHFRASLAPCGAEALTRCIQVTAIPQNNKSSKITFSLDTYGNRLPEGKW